MNIISGGAVVAMKGMDCVAIVTDKRCGTERETVAGNFPKVFQIGPTLFVGFPGLATDTQTVYQRIKFRKNLYELKEKRMIRPRVLSSMLTNLLYERRFAPYLIECVVAGLDPYSHKPFICELDVIGSTNEPEDFVVAGSCPRQLFGMCEALWEPDMCAEHLFETISQALVNSVDRDTLSGWGAVAYVVEKDKVTEKHIKTRMD